MDIEKFAIKDETMRLLLRHMPGGALAINNNGEIPYDILLKYDIEHRYDSGRRLLLLAGAPSLHPETRRQMNYEARRTALIAFFAPRRPDQIGREGPDICSRLLCGAGSSELIRHIIGFL